METNGKRKAIGYVRHALAKSDMLPQINELQEYANRKSYDLIQVFEDNGIAGSRVERPGIASLMAFLKSQSSGMPVLIRSLSVLARSIGTYQILTVAIHDAGGRIEYTGIDQKDG